MIRSQWLRIWLILFVLSSLAGMEAREGKGPPDDNEVRVSYVGNAGFLIRIGDRKILVDALFKGFAGSYELPQAIEEKLKLAQAPFDNVDLILVTHAHGDHVNADMVTQHMYNNPRAIFASTPQVVGMLNGISGRSVVFDPSEGDSDLKEIGEFSVESFFLPHGANSETINIGFLVTVNGITFFQTGDADFEQFSFDQFRSLRLPEKNIDLAFIQHDYLRGDSGDRRFVDEGIGARILFPIHYHFTNPPFDGALVLKHYPDAIIFTEEMHSWQMPGKNDFPVLKGDYLGQPKPGNTPRVFARGIVSSDHKEHWAPRFSPDGSEVFWWTIRHEGDQKWTDWHRRMRRTGDQWTAPEPSPFDRAPVFSPDGKRLYFGSRNEGENPCFVEKRQNGWSTPEDIDLVSRFPEIRYVYFPTVTRNGTLYFMGYLQGQWADIGIYRAECSNGEYARPELLPACINSSGGMRNWTPFIAPDESYLIFCSTRNLPPSDQGDLYISFRTPDGAWTDPVGMGETINSKGLDRFPAVTPDGRFLFFTQSNPGFDEDVYWVSSDIISSLKAKLRSRD